MSENWTMYLCEVEGKPAAVRVDLEAESQQNRPVSLLVKLHLNRPRKDGLSDRSEFEQLCTIEDALIPSVTRELKAEHVGCVTVGGVRDFYFYAPPQCVLADAQKVVSKAMSAFPNYKSTCTTADDPQWQHYFEFLYPTRMQLEAMKNRQVLEQLAQQGDNFAAPRVVDHFAFFPDESKRKDFEKLIAPMGFDTQLMEPEENEQGVTWYGLQFSKEHAVDPQSIDSVVDGLLALLQEFDGEYDGWGCPVVAD